MIWTSELPNKEGWYWLKLSKYSKEIVFVQKDNRMNIFWVILTSLSREITRLKLDNFNECQWAGPISEPIDYKNRLKYVIYRKDKTI